MVPSPTRRASPAFSSATRSECRGAHALAVRALRRAWPALAALVPLALPVADAGGASAEPAAATVCAACHGEGGRSVAPAFPTLAGQQAEYLQKQLIDFAKGRRTNEVMTAALAQVPRSDFPTSSRTTPRSRRARKDRRCHARGSRPQDLRRRRLAGRNTSVPELPRRPRRRQRALSSPRWTESRVHAATARGLQGRHAPQRSAPHDARGRRSAERSADEGARRISRGALARLPSAAQQRRHPATDQAVGRTRHRDARRMGHRPLPAQRPGARSSMVSKTANGDRRTETRGNGPEFGPHSGERPMGTSAGGR